MPHDEEILFVEMLAFTTKALCKFLYVQMLTCII